MATSIEFIHAFDVNDRWGRGQDSLAKVSVSQVPLILRNRIRCRAAGAGERTMLTAVSKLQGYSARQHKAMAGHAAFSRMPALAIRCSRFPFHCSSSVFVTGKSMMHIHSLSLLSRLLYMDVTATITTITITATTGDMVLRDTRDCIIHRIMTYTFLET